MAKKEGLIRSLLLPFLTRVFDRKKAQQRPAPDFDEKVCIRCKKCIDICPAKALTLTGGKVVIDKGMCIRCYCCHEMSPKGAIDIRKQKGN